VLRGEQGRAVLPAFASSPEVDLLTPAVRREATFDVDFAEVVFAEQALRRHLRDRAAWSTDGVEGSGLEGVLQAAARAPAGPWTVALRRVGPRLEVHALSSEELAVLRQLETGASVDVPGDLATRLLRRGLVSRSGR
jgi:hypothetical protein